MSLTTLALSGIGVILALGLGGVALAARRRHVDRWLIPLLGRSLANAATGRRRRSGEPVHLILAIADHYEPNAEDAPADVALGRVEHWLREYPRALGSFRDADGRPPRHTFFYPIETYDPDQLDRLAELCRLGFGEVEIHLHHDGDDAEHLRATLAEAVETLSRRHGLLARRRDDGTPAYAFVHGNWALDNARPDGRWCGVNDEIRVLRETGCYVDMTYPSAPSPTQPPTVNRIYYATSTPHHPRGHDRGCPIGRGPAPDGALMLIEGPLALDFRRPKWGLLPRLENGCLQTSQPPAIERVALWLQAGVQVPSRRDWYFVKLHAHGAPERDRDTLLGPAMIAFHRALQQRAERDPRFFVHYVTAREMYNLARAAEAGWAGTVADARDFELLWGGGSEGDCEAAITTFSITPQGARDS